MNLNALTVHEAQDLLCRGETNVSSTLPKLSLAQIEAHDETIHAYVTVTTDKGRERKRKRLTSD